MRPYLPKLALISCLAWSLSCAHSAPSASKPGSLGTPSKDGDTSTAEGHIDHEDGQALSAEVLTSIAKGHYLELRACYEAELKERPELRGIVEVELTIDSNGHIREGRIINDNIGDPDLQFCIAQRILGWKFPPHADESLTIQFPFEFAPILVEGPIQD